MSEGHFSNRAFEGLDRSKIPSTPDSLISEGDGLQLFLMAARTMGPRIDDAATPRLPTTAVGEHPKPSFMSTGRAFRMFGPPEDPGEDALPENDELAALSVALQDRNAVSSQPTSATAARTEREYREKDEQQSTTIPTLSEELQWKQFDRKKFMNRTEILAAHYNRLAVMKKASKKKSIEAQADEATTAADTSSWPNVENPDFAGLTNWIAACQQADKKFGLETMPKWAEDRKQRQAVLQEKLAGEPPFDDQILGLGSPAKFYSGEPILQTTLRKLGHRPLKKKKKK
ncbi:hypothetical protein NU195Hw_g2829t1 [Hortaea werneckii]